MEDGILVIDFDDGAIREHASDALQEDVPFAAAVEVVAHEEAAAHQILAHFGAFGVGQVRVTHFDRIDPRPIENFVAVEVHYLFGRTSVDAGEAAHALHKLAVGLRVIGGPTADLAKDTGVPAGRVHEAGEGPFGLFIGIGGHRNVVVFHCGKLAESGLEGEQGRHRNGHKTTADEQAAAHLDEALVCVSG